MHLSIIIPTLNEQSTIAAQLRHLSGLQGIDEVIVADGGSTDATLDIVRQSSGALTCAFHVLMAPTGRASQMNAGARLAQGEILLFLHSDVRLPANAAVHVRGAMKDVRVVAGAFHTWTVATGSHRWGPLLHLADLRSRYSNLPYGDQAVFVRRSAFDKIGGFPDQPLMEDLELSRMLRQHGRIKVVPARVLVSARRFLAHPVKYTLLMNTFPILYRWGVSPARLAQFYKNER